MPWIDSMRKWDLLRLGDIVSIRHGYAFEGKYFSDTEPGPVLVTPGNFKIGGGWQWGKAKYYHGPVPAGFTLHRGDIVVTMTDLSKGADTLGYSAKIPFGGPFLHNQRIGRVEVTAPDLLDPDFLYYVLMGRRYRQHVMASATGSTVRHTSPSRILEFSCRAPRLKDQRAMANVLGALDAKTESNRRCVVTQDQLLDDLFKMTPTLGTGAVPLSAVAILALGGTPDRKRPEYWTNGTIPWINSSKSNDMRIIEPSEMITEEALARSTTKIMPKGATVVAITGATLGTVSRIEIETTGNQSLVGIWASDQRVNDWLYFWLRSHRGELMCHATGGAQQHVNKGDVAELLVEIPELPELSRWHSIAQPLLENIASALRENVSLAQTRDTVLNPLLSGEMSVRIAKQPSEAVM